MSVSWEQPPRLRTQTEIKATRLADEIASRPNEWACIATYPEDRTAAARSRAYKINHGIVESFTRRPGGKFEATCRRVPEGWKVYVRFRTKGGE